MEVQLRSDSDVRFWSDLDLEYVGDLGSRLDLRLSQSGRLVAETSCDPFRYTFALRKVVTNWGDRHAKRYKAKMDCSVRVPTDGITRVDATLIFRGQPSRLVISKLNLIITQ